MRRRKIAEHWLSKGDTGTEVRRKHEYETPLLDKRGTKNQLSEGQYNSDLVPNRTGPSQRLVCTTEQTEKSTQETYGMKNEAEWKQPQNTYCLVPNTGNRTPAQSCPLGL